jgi:hypothetical protein
MLPMVLFGLLFFFDYFAFGFLKKIKWKPFAHAFYYIDKFYRYITLIFIYDTLYYVFISNIKRRIILSLIVALIMGNAIIQRNKPEGHIYFPTVKSSKNIMKYRNYENQFKERDSYHEGLYPHYPFINSDIITGDYIKLYIPYHPIQNRPLEKICPEIIDIFSKGSKNEVEQIEKQKIILECINNAYSLSIDNKKIKSDFIFADYSHTLMDIKTFIMLIPLNQYANGRHSLNMKKIFKDKIESITFDSDDIDEDEGNGSGPSYNPGSDSTYTIPFYIMSNK